MYFTYILVGVNDNNIESDVTENLDFFEEIVNTGTNSSNGRWQNVFIYSTSNKEEAYKYLADFKELANRKEVSDWLSQE